MLRASQKIRVLPALQNSVASQCSNFSTKQTIKDIEDNYGLEASLSERAKARDKSLRLEHESLKTDVSASNYGTRSIDPDDIRRKRIIYRSKQRGWLEVDLLLGTWAVKHVPDLTVEELDQYETILNRETMDIFNYITGKEAPPPEIDNAIMVQLKKWTVSSPLGVASPVDYEAAKENSNLT